MNKTIFVLVNLVGLWTFSVVGWGEDGHKMIAQIAADLLNPTASGIVSQYIGSKTLPDIAPLPDDYDHTAEGKWSEPMHFCNLPKGATNFTMADCPGLCVVKAIQNYTQRLMEDQANPTPCQFGDTDEPCPLEFLVHFVGDVHQPLHVGFGYDEGGNDVAVTWYGTATNLHHVWDDDIIDSWDDDWSDAAQQLESMMDDANETELVKHYEGITNPIDWADESFQYVLTTCYNFTGSDSVADKKSSLFQQGKSRKISVNDGTAKTARRSSKRVRIADPTDTPALGNVYYDRNLPIVQQRLIAAGVRLAHLLNAILTGV